MPLRERVWIGRDGLRYRARIAGDRLIFLGMDGRHLGSVPAEERELASLDAEELEALLEKARAGR